MLVKKCTIQRAAGVFSVFAVAALTALAAWGASLAGGAGNSARAAAHKASLPGSLVFTDLHGKSYGARDIAAHKASVFLFISSQCPVSNVYTPRFLSLANEYGSKGVEVFAVYSDRQESLADVRKHAQQRGFTFPAIKDTRAALADRLGAAMTPEAIVVDASGVVRYRGRIDDNVVATHVTTHDLNDALDALLAGKPIAHPKTLAFGCAIRHTTTPVVAAKGVPTYAYDVAPILRAKCENCHRPGEVAPFSLQTYQQASAWATDIKRYTQNGQMPPWKPAPGYGEFAQAAARCLTDQEKTTLAKWADANAPQGNPKQIPPPRQFTEGWQLGKPDLILMPDRPYHLAADGDDVYRNFVVPTDFTEDRFLSAVEVRPGNRAVVHHVIGFIDGFGASVKLEGKDHDGEPGYTSFGGPGFIPTGMIGGWAPGMIAQFLPDGVGTRIPKGAHIVIQVHYHKDGKPETDLTKLGLYFCHTTVNKQIYNPMVLNFTFQIPPGDSHYEVHATTPIFQDVHVLAVLPHMHLLGKEMKVWATLPDGTEKPLVWIKNWDFNWQAAYGLKEPLALPAGSKVHLIAYYDNSDQNPRNPNKGHLHTIHWGEQTTDEMCLAFFTVTHDNEHLAWQPPPSPVQAAAGAK